jgi:hypothetical protein
MPAFPSVVATWYGGSSERPREKINPLFALFAALHEYASSTKFGMSYTFLIVRVRLHKSLL